VKLEPCLEHLPLIQDEGRLVSAGVLEIFDRRQLLFRFVAPPTVSSLGPRPAAR
jgi:hypothetical protein